MASAGSRIGKFVIRTELGRGGMGIVYLAEDTELRRDVALKLLLAERINEERRLRFRREARAAVLVSHPNIIAVYAVGEDAGAIYIAMEYVKGCTLRTHLKQRAGIPLPIPEALQIARAIAHGLESAHGAGIIHRDLKPENVMLSQDGLIKILDFGLAKLTAQSDGDAGGERTISSDEELTTQGRVLGTPSYMSPEQVTGRPLDLSSDLFSLGVILYEMVTGVRPFRGSTRMEVLIAIDRDEPEPASKQNPAVSARLDRLLARCMAKRPEQRYARASEIVSALDQLLAGPNEPAATVGSGIHHHELETIDSSIEHREVRPARMPLGRVFTTDERALIAVILIGPASSHLVEELRHEVTQRGGHAEVTADGSLAAMFAERRIATDQAAHAARAALALRRLAPVLPIALAMSRGEGASKDAPTELFARARKLLAGPVNAILLDELTAGLLSAHFDVRSSEDRLLLLGELRIPDGARTLLGKPTPCVGRERELATLAALFNECVEAPLARVALVVAPPGMGKSRLAHELVHRLRRRHGAELSIWTSAGDCRGQAAPLSLLAQALRAECEIRGDESLLGRQEKLTRRVARWVPAGDRKRVTEFLGEIIQVPFPDDDNPPLRAARRDSELMNELLRQAFVDFIGAETSRSALLLVLEDLHWGDSHTVRFIDAALRAHGDKPLLVLALARPEVHDRFPKLWATRDAHVIHMKELSRKAAEQLVWQVLGRATSPALVERLIDLADGQAFYLEELIRAAALRPSVALPATVVAMVEARLMGLSADERRLLRAASVFGEVFWQSAVAEVAGGATAELLTKLVECEVIVRRPVSQLPGEREYAFRHALLREGAYAMLTDADLVLGHRLAAEWLELHDARNPLVIAEHFERGERPLLAAGFYNEAAAQAHHTGDGDAAIAYSQRGLSCGATGAVRDHLLWVLADALSYRSELDQAQPFIKELLEKARPGSGAYMIAAKYTMTIALFKGDFGELSRVVNSALAVDPAPEAFRDLSMMLMSCAVILPSAGQHELAEGYLHKLREFREGIGRQSPVVRGWTHFAVGFNLAGSEQEPESALRESEAAYACLFEAGHVKEYGIARILVGMSAWFLGDLARAESAFFDPCAVDPNLPAMAAHRVAVLTDLRLSRGELTAAQLSASALIERGLALHHPFDEGFGRYALAKVLNAAGDQDAAAREALRAGQLLVMPVHRLWALSLLSVIRRSQGRSQEACAVAAEAVHECEALRWYAYRSTEVKLAYIEALLAVGDKDQAQSRIADLKQRLLATAAQLSAPELRTNFLRNVPTHARIMELAGG